MDAPKLIYRTGVFFICLVAVVVFCSPGLWAAALHNGPASVTIKVHETGLVNRDHVLLGDIAQIEANAILKEALAEIDLGASPKPGGLKSFSGRRVRQAVRSQQYLPKDISLSAPERIYVKRPGQSLSPRTVRRFVEAYLSGLYPDDVFNMEAFNVRGLETYPQGDLELKLLSGDVLDKNGRLSGYIGVDINGERQDKLSISGKAALFKTVLCAKRLLKKGQALYREDLVALEKNIFDLGGNYVSEFDGLEGKILKAALKKGECIKPSLVETPPLVKKGDMIRLLSKNESLTIVTAGISREDGFADKLIQVENISSGKIVRGIVKGKSIVEVVY